MSDNYEFHWSKTYYYRSVVSADSFNEAIEKQKQLFDSGEWDDFEDDEEITYYELEWVDERRATDAEREYFSENFDKDFFNEPI